MLQQFHTIDNDQYSGIRSFNAEKIWKKNEYLV